MGTPDTLGASLYRGVLCSEVKHCVFPCREEEEVGMDLLDEVGVNLQVSGGHVTIM